MDLKLRAEIHREGEWFVGFCHEVPEANGQGRTPEECLQSLKDAVLLLMEDRREFICHLEVHGCPFKREGGSHTTYWNPATGRREPVPRQNEIPDLLVRKICRALTIPDPGRGE